MLSLFRGVNQEMISSGMFPCLNHRYLFSITCTGTKIRQPDFSKSGFTPVRYTLKTRSLSEPR